MREDVTYVTSFIGSDLAQPQTENSPVSCIWVGVALNSLRPSDAYMRKLTSIGSDNGLSPGLHQAIIWTNAGILLTWPLGTNVGEILIQIHTFSFKKMHLKMSSGKWRPFCLGLNVLKGRNHNLEVMENRRQHGWLLPQLQYGPSAWWPPGARFNIWVV